MNRPKLFVDTNICIYAANGKIPADEWRRVRRHISKTYRYCISFITLKELFVKLARGKDEFFEQNKTPLNVLLQPRSQFLPYPSVFALRTVLGLHSLSRKNEFVDLPEEEWAKQVLAAVLQAPSKAQLKAGIPIPNSTRRKQSFDLDHFDQHENRPQNEHADILQGLRDGRTDPPEPISWAASILHDHDLQSDAQQATRLAVALDAAYRFSCTLSEMSKDKGYDFQKHASDWGDAGQLFYLCDESMHFLTFDANCRNHVLPSTQASRILIYQEFVKTLPK